MCGKIKMLKKFIWKTFRFLIYTIIINTTTYLVTSITQLKKEYFMANSQELFEQIKDLFVQFESEHNGTSKAAKSRARKAIGEIKKLVTDYRKASVEENK